MTGSTAILPRSCASRTRANMRSGSASTATSNHPRRTDCERAESRDLHRWRVLGESWTRRLGGHLEVGRAREGDLRRRTADDEQPDGADGSDQIARSLEEAKHRGDPHRFALCDGRAHPMAAALEAE